MPYNGTPPPKKNKPENTGFDELKDLIPTFSKSEKIILCYYCHGEGMVSVHVENPRYEGPWERQCPACEGSGRRVMEVSIKYKPFK
jgi:hypothetical protein